MALPHDTTLGLGLAVYVRDTKTKKKRTSKERETVVLLSGITRNIVLPNW